MPGFGYRPTAFPSLRQAVSLRRSLATFSRTSLNAHGVGTQKAPLAQPSFRPCRFLSTEHKQAIDKAVAIKPVVVFMKGTPAAPMCGFSRAVVQVLEMEGLDFSKDVQTYNVLEDQDLRTAIKEYSSWPTVPQVYVGSEFIGGCDIILDMHSKGELVKELTSQGVDLSQEAPA